MPKWKFNWGTGLALVLALFIGAMTLVMVKASKHNNDLVTSDYYVRELAYQETIERKRNALALSGSCSLKVVQGKIQLQFPQELIGQTAQAHIELYCQTDARKDFTLKEENWTVAHIHLPTQKMTTGKWIAKVTLDTEASQYYFDPSIVIP